MFRPDWQQTLMDQNCNSPIHISFITLPKGLRSYFSKLLLIRSTFPSGCHSGCIKKIDLWERMQGPSADVNNGIIC